MIYLVIGRRKRGKTTLAYYMARKTQAPRLIYDPRCMIPSDSSTRSGVPHFLESVPPPMIRESIRVTTAHDFQAWTQALADGDVCEVIYSPSEDDLTRPFAVFSRELKRWTIESPTRPLAVVIDELGFMDPSRRDPPELRRALRSCEPELLDVFITCHRPSDVPTSTRSIADYWALFQVTQEHDLDVVRERCKKDVAERVQLLTGRSFILYRDTRTIDPTTQREQPEWELYPERLDASGHTPWYVPLTALEQRAYRDRFDDLERESAARNHLDGRLPID